MAVLCPIVKRKKISRKSYSCIFILFRFSSKQIIQSTILSKILSPRQNCVATTFHIKLNWSDFARLVAATKFCRGDKISIIQWVAFNFNQPMDSVQTRRFAAVTYNIAAMSAYDLSLDFTHKATCCSDVLQQFVA